MTLIIKKTFAIFSALALVISGLTTFMVAPIAAEAATINVYAMDTLFSPQNITVNPGDTVVWTNQGGSQRTIISDNGLFNSAALATGSTFSYTFNASGTFNYSGGNGMSGTITVTPGTTTPVENKLIGNDGSVRSVVDGASNFTIIDKNHPATAAGQIMSFGYYASNMNPFRFVVVNSSNMIKYISPLITPSVVGANTYTLASTITVSAGDNIGLHFSSTGTVPYSDTGANAMWTSIGTDAGPTVGMTLNLPGSGARTYSIVAFGTTTVTPPPVKQVDFPGFAFGKVEYDSNEMHQSVSFFAVSNSNTWPFFGSGALIYKDANGEWYNVTVRYATIRDGDAFLAGRITSASRSSWVNQWVYVKVHDGGSTSDQISISMMRSIDAARKFTQRIFDNPLMGPFNITNGSLMVVGSLDFSQ